MAPRVPKPYRTTTYKRPQAALRFAQRLKMPDGALIATFVYGNESAPLSELLSHDVVLALHGNGGSHGTFAEAIDSLCTAGLTVIAFDSRAQGQSTRGTRPLTYELMTEDAVHVLDALDVGAANVVGYSDGGIEALLLARDYAERVISVVASGANLTPEGVVDDPAWDTPGSAAINRTWAAFMEKGELPPQIDTTLLPSAEEALLASELLQLTLDEPHIEAASLASISCPVCVMAGEHDCIVPEETHTIANNIPGARMVIVPDVGHSIPRLAPDSLALQVMTNVLISKTR